jgi:GntR family transcriptional regulator/MocR family aminotransferase
MGVMARKESRPKASKLVQSLRVDPTAGEPVYRQIAEQLVAAARAGRVGASGRLPPTRDLARSLDVNRNTVVAAYRHLADAGAVRSFTGRGTFLVRPEASAPSRDSGTAWPGEYARAVEGAGIGNLLSVYRTATSHEGISFAGSYPAAELLPVAAFGKAVGAVLREHGADVLGYGPTAGHPPLRERIAADLRRGGAQADADGVMITNGSQQAIEIVFRALVDPGDAVILEDPSYTGALSVLSSLGARRVGVAMDSAGIRPDLLARALEQHRPRLMYLQPTFHNPTTRTIDERRRREILELASRHRCAIVEDDWGRDLRLDGTDLPTLHALDGGEHVIHVGTFSKKLLPGLRVGWVAARRGVFERLQLLKQIEDCGTSLLLQAALDRYLADGGAEDHLARARDAYRVRRDRMWAALRGHAPRSARYEVPQGGLFFWVSLPDGVDTDALAHDARERGVLFSRGSLFHVDGGGRNTLRLTYSAATLDEIDAGIATLGELMKRRMAARGRLPRDAALEGIPIL